jgi:hypothetical protein
MFMADRLLSLMVKGGLKPIIRLAKIVEQSSELQVDEKYGKLVEFKAEEAKPFAPKARRVVN